MPTVHDVIRRSARAYAKTVLFAHKTGFRTETWTYEEFYAQGKKLSAWFSENNVKKGDRLLVYSPNTPWYAVALLACAISGVILVPVDFNSREDFVRKLNSLVKAKLLFTVKSAPKTGIRRQVYLEDLPELLRGVKPGKHAKVRESDLLEIVYTSGTTGNPKGVLITHGNLVANMQAVRRAVSLKRNHVFLSILPLSHLLEQTVGLLAAIDSGHTVVYPHARSSSALIEALNRHGVNAIAGVPVFLKMLRENVMREAERQGKAKQLEKLVSMAGPLPVPLRRLIFGKIHRKLGGKLKFFFVGGAPLEREVEVFWNRIGIKVLQGYGLTEASPVVACNTFYRHKAGSAGKALDGVDIRLGPDNEVLIRGPSVTRGYYKNARATRQAFDNGWYRTGDVGYFDSEGFLFIKGRKKNMILTSGGQNVYPEDIEAVINRFPEVSDSCAVQIGDRIAAAVLAEKKFSAKALLDKANDRLSAAQQLSQIIIWPQADFPRTTTRKIKRAEVVKTLSGARMKQGTPGTDRLVQTLQEMSGKRRITGRTRLVKDLNLTSLDRVELITIIEEKFGVEVDESVINEKTTVASLRKAIETRDSKARHLPFYGWALRPGIMAFRVCLQFLLFGVIRLFARIRYEGLENLKGVHGPVIFMSNHTSHLDTPVILAGLPGKIRRKTAVAAAMDYLFEGTMVNKKFYFMFVTLFLNAYPFSRDKTNFIRKSLNYTGFLLDKGFSILIFPEGTRNPTGKMGAFKTGTGLLAVHMKTAIVPVRVRELDGILPPGAAFPRPGRGSVRFGRPIEVSSESYIEATKIIEEKVREL